jgi:PAS domain S-box-containing protein
MQKLWLKYIQLVESRLLRNVNESEYDLCFWQNKLFCIFLIYCAPVSLVALVPGVIVSIQSGYYFVGAIDLLAFSAIIITTLAHRLSPNQRKAAIIIIFYVLAVFLINTLGYIGPGVFYLFFITILTALVLPVKYAYWSVAANTLLLLAFALIINFNLLNSALVVEYTPAKWLAFSSNLIFASAIIVSLVDRLFEKLQQTLNKKIHLKERYQSIFNKSPLPMWIFDTKTLNFLEVNEAASRHYGYTSEEFLQMSIKDIRSAEHVEQVKEIVDINRRTGNYYEGSSQHIKKNGEHIYVQVKSNLLYLQDQAVRLVLATDITELVKQQLEVLNATQKIHESESNLRAIFDNAVEGFVLLDANHCIKLFNSQALQSINFNKDQKPFAVGADIFEYVETERVNLFRHHLERVYSGKFIEYDREFIPSEDAVYWIRYTLNPVYEDNVVIGACITGKDITARKLYLKTIEDQNKVYREISWMQSHLVRAPLARIMGLTPMLEHATDTTERDTILKYINISTNELDTVIREISKKTNELIDEQPAPA